jgi:hypothetical protein
MEAGEGFELLSSEEYADLPDIEDLFGEIRRQDALHLLTKRDVLELSAGERKQKLMSLWVYYHPIPQAVEKDLGNLVPEDLLLEIIDEELPKDPDDSKYDYLLYRSLSRYYGVRNEYILNRLKRINQTIDSVVGDEEELERCPCCGYRTLDQRNMYFICPVCFWEDDGDDDDEEYSGPNHMTLGQGRENFRQYGACDKAFLMHVDKEGTLKYKKS